MKFFKSLRARHWAWTLVLATAGIWWPGFVLATPPDFLQESIDPGVLVFCMVVAIIGSVIKIIGYLASQMPGRAGVIGVSVELAGLILASVGPASYILASLFGFFAPGPVVNFSSAFILACSIAAMYLYRAIVIVPRFIFEAHDSAKDDS